MSETDHERWRDELAAHALGALDLGEAAELEQHLAGCEACRAELEWLRPAVQLLPESVPRVGAPPRLRQNLIEQVRAEAGDERSWWRLRRPDGGWALRPLAGLAALVLIVAAVAGYAIGGGGSSSGTPETTAFAGHSPGVTAEVVSNGKSGTLHLANLHQLPNDKVLQAWVQREKKVVSAKTLFVPNSDGTATATIDDMEGVEAVMVTAEPRGGSLQPTSAPIVAVPVSN